MTNKKIIFYILASFVVGNLLLVFMQYNSTKNIDGLLKGNEQLLNEFRVDRNLKSLEKSILTIEKEVQNTFVSEDTAYQRSIRLQVTQVNDLMTWLQQLNDDDSSDALIYHLNFLVQEKLRLSQQVLDTFRLKGKEAAEELFVAQEHQLLTQQIDKAASDLDNHRKILLTNLNKIVDGNGHRARQWGIILIILVLISGAGLFWFIINRLGRQNELIDQLNNSEKKVRDAARVKENFLANMSHEIRTPMNAILGFTRLLQKRSLDTTSREHLDAIQSSGDKLLTIINDILDLSKIEAGMMRIETAPFGVRELLHSVETMFGERTKEKGLTLLSNVDPQLPDMLKGDATRLTQILVNIVGNAVKFTDKGHISIALTQEGLKDHQLMLGIRVSDTGIGIDQDKLPFVFERFRQAEDSVTRHYGGTGLGLSIVKDLVDIQGGTIRAESEPGKGTSFMLVIPYQLPDSDGILTEQTAAPTAALPQLHRIRLLVAEDNRINQQLMKHLLTDWQLDFDMAANGREAIELLHSHHYDLLLMDIQMPEMDGYTATREIRHTLRIDTPIIAMTAHAMAGEREKCLSLGMNDYISKPIDEDILYKMIARFAGATNMSNKRLSKAVPHNNTRSSAAHADATLNMEEPPLSFQYISLQYMQDIGGGDLEYERTITEQFLEVIPEELAAMEQAWQQKDFTQLSQRAHNMKTSVSVMGLTDRLTPALDALEFRQEDETSLHTHLATVKEVCEHALLEASAFYATLN